MQLQLVVLIPYLFQVVFGLHYMSGELFLPQDTVVQVEVPNSASVHLNFFPLGRQPICQLCQRLRSQKSIVLNEVRQLSLFVEFTPVTDRVMKTFLQILPLFPNGDRPLANDLFSFLPDFVLGLQGDLPHILEEICSGEGEILGIVVFGDCFESVEGGGVVPQFDLFFHGGAVLGDTFEVGCQLVIIWAFFHSDGFPLLELSLPVLVVEVFLGWSQCRLLLDTRHILSAPLRGVMPLFFLHNKYNQDPIITQLL